MWANFVPLFVPQRISEHCLVLPPEGSGIPHSNKQRFPEPPHGWVLVLTDHLAAAVDRVGAKTETPREFWKAAGFLQDGALIRPTHVEVAFHRVSTDYVLSTGLIFHGGETERLFEHILVENAYYPDKNPLSLVEGKSDRLCWSDIFVLFFQVHFN
ncbi:hypothetical protein XU18_3030 [Perkinsela sp. CCAP 1560/4]|nr:hypothetical protein XU18_3030 [Perkinsela sp. CCAP 1560/4]|eukprot:KNH06093.1 hypothetical protein XU18_3030 [Perkinsela sp. CCAP 1560/4]